MNVIFINFAIIAEVFEIFNVVGVSKEIYFGLLLLCLSCEEFRLGLKLFGLILG